MINLKWIKGILKFRGGRLLGAIAGTAVTISLLASLGSYITYSGSTMTKRAISKQEFSILLRNFWLYPGAI